MHACQQVPTGATGGMRAGGEGYTQGFCRFVLLRVRVLVLRVLSLASPSCQKTASHQESRCVPISSILQQVLHYKRKAQPQGMRKWLGQRWSCSLIHTCSDPHLPLTTFFAENKEKLGRALLHACVHVCHQADQLVPEGRADLWSHLHIF